MSANLRKTAPRGLFGVNLPIRQAQVAVLIRAASEMMSRFRPLRSALSGDWEAYGYNPGDSRTPPKEHRQDDAKYCSLRALITRWKNVGENYANKIHNHFANAILVARLEDKLGFDPFTESDVIHYPVTLGDFIQLYESTAKQREVNSAKIG
jgi:hypothetical protein